MSDTNQSLQQRRLDAIPRGVGQIHQIFADRAENATVWDVEGREYLDFAGGIAVLNTGHLHPKVMAAVQAQQAKLTHTCFHVFAYAPYVELCEKLNKLVPGDFAKKTLLVTTGAEAVENAIKIARAHTGRTGVIAFTGAYHGRTHYTLSLTGKVVPYSAGMGLMPGGIYRAMYPNELHGISIDDAIASIERIFKNDAQPSDIAAIILEPVQGEGGFTVAPKAFMQRLRALCDEHGIVLIADEVQTGAGRTGTFFAMEQMGIAADLTTFAKSIAGGFPLAGVAGKAEIMDAVAPGGLGGTYAGSPVSCAAALAVIEAFEEEKLLDRAKSVGEILTTGLRQIGEKHNSVLQVRNLGAMVAVELCEGGDASKPNAELTGKIVARARDKGLILLSCGTYYNVLRILVPLTVSDADLARGLGIIAECFDELA
ncbi:4-aminobutyrate--2-oxoglutarate transaminase [Pseudomonas akapageensis]|uniref:4-aminobutyrate--2-oxoglutarate transaminase n=1 Tax=Pseudomonas akapageensis TaxID=2609961 RepID=UPI00140CCDF0|nr:4-aminobutyrate--2-oxoglutarate transaminase [Pseudomonas akapageensis]